MLKSQSQADSMIMKETTHERKERIKQNNILMKSIYQGSLFKDTIKAEMGLVKKPSSYKLATVSTRDKIESSLSPRANESQDTIKIKEKPHKRLRYTENRHS